MGTERGELLRIIYMLNNIRDQAYNYERVKNSPSIRCVVEQTDTVLSLLRKLVKKEG